MPIADAELVFQYRQMIIDMILKTVSIAGDNATGDEYEERAVLQEQLEVYIEVRVAPCAGDPLLQICSSVSCSLVGQAYTVLVGEWCYGILGVRSTLADQFKAQQSAIFFVEENLLLPSPGRVNSRKRSAKTAQLDGSDEEYGDDRMERRDDGSKAGTDPTRKVRPAWSYLMIAPSYRQPDHPSFDRFDRRRSEMQTSSTTRSETSELPLSTPGLRRQISFATSYSSNELRQRVTAESFPRSRHFAIFVSIAILCA